MWKNLDPSEQAEYRQLDNAKLEEPRKKFIEKHLSAGEFEEKYGSDFEKVVAKVEELFKLGFSQNDCLFQLLNLIPEHRMQESKDNRELEPFLDVCEGLQSQRKMINNTIARAVRSGRPINTDELIAGHNESLQAAKKQFPDYELPLTVQLDVHYRDQQRLFHRKISSRLLRKFRTGRIDSTHKWKVRNPMTSEKIKREFEETVQKLIARNRVCQYIFSLEC